MTFQLLSQPMAITGESPLWDEVRQCLWWIDIQAQRLLCSTMEGDTQCYPCPWQPGFIAFGESGALVVGMENGLWTYTPENKTWIHVVALEDDRPTVRLNDGKPDCHGRLFFGSMDMTGTGRAIGRLYCRATDGEIFILREDVTIPNAIVPFPDGTGLWFADSKLGKVDALTLSLDARRVEGQREFYRTPNGTHPDGACIDEKGNLLVALIGSGEIIVLSPDGTEVSRQSPPISRATMPLLGGPNGSTLFITSQRRFLSPSELAQQPAAGGLLIKKQVEHKAASVSKVAGL